MKCYMFFVAMMVTIQIKMYTCTPTGLFYVLPDNSTNASCPSQPCATLSQYLLNMSVMSNVKYLFLSGKHHLTSNITIQLVHNVTMRGINYDTLAPAMVFCFSETFIIFNNNIIIIIILFFSYNSF